jgi:hypothetical protein
MLQTITRIPVAGATILDKPLLVESQAKCGEHVVRNGQVFDKREIIVTILRICRWDNRWQRSGLDNYDFLRRVNDKSWLDQRSLDCGRAKGSWCRGGGTS